MKYLPRLIETLGCAAVEDTDAHPLHSASYNNTYIYLEHAECNGVCITPPKAVAPHNDHVASDALARLLDAIHQLRFQGQRLTQRAIKIAGNVSEHTIAKYADVLYVAQTLGTSQYTTEDAVLSGTGYPLAFQIVAQWGEQLLAPLAVTADLVMRETCQADLQIVEQELASRWPLSRTAIELIVESYYAACSLCCQVDSDVQGANP